MLRVGMYLVLPRSHAPRGNVSSLSRSHAPRASVSSLHLVPMLRVGMSLVYISFPCSAWECA